MSDISRRNLLRSIALSSTLGGLTAEAAQHVHQMASEEAVKTGEYEPKVFQPREWHALDALAELIVPGARQGGAREFIDLLASENDELASLFTGGLGWLDAQSQGRFDARFADASEASQRQLLDDVAFRENDSPDLRAGILFFDWARKMVADAYYTSKAGIEELGYQGNRGMTEFRVPEEAMRYALQRAGFDEPA